MGFSLSVLESLYLLLSPSPLDFSLSELESVYLWLSPSPLDFSLSVLESVYLSLWISLSVCWNLFISRCGFLSQCVGICLSLAVDFSLSVLESVYLWLSPSPLDFSLSVLESVYLSLWISLSVCWNLTAVPSLHFSSARGPARGAVVTRSHNPGSDVPAVVSVTQKNTFSWVRKKNHKKSESDVYVF